MKRVLAFAAKVPLVIAQAVGIVEKIKSAPGDEKKKAVLESIYDIKLLAEFGIGKELMEDSEVKEIIDTYLEAEVSLMKLREQVIDVITKKGEAQSD